jgi:predicted Fe-Mo cluster-binding NifX family protein
MPSLQEALAYKIFSKENLMKIALPSVQNNVDAHFGHCEYFTVVTVNEKNQIVKEEKVMSPAGCGCKSDIVHTLSQMGVSMMLAGNMGEGAVNVLNSHGIEVLRGCAGDVKRVAEEWLAGTLKDPGEACHAHGHGCHEA